MRIAFVGNFTVPYSSENHHKRSLEALGHEVIALQEGIATTTDISVQALTSQMLVWVHTHGWVTPQDGALTVAEVLKLVSDTGIPTVTYHLDLWFGLQRQRDLEDDPFYKSIDWFFTVDKRMADWFNRETSVKGRYLQAGVFHAECQHYDSMPNRDVIFVGSKNYHPEWEYRPKLINWLRETYGDRFTHVGGDGDTGTVRGFDLNKIYNESKVAVGDTLCINFDYPYYWSDRVYETLGRGGFMIHPYISGMEKHFTDGKHLVFYQYGNFNELKEKINYFLAHDEHREAIRLDGHLHVKKNHTYLNRWNTIIEEVRHG